MSTTPQKIDCQRNVWGPPGPARIAVGSGNDPKRPSLPSKCSGSSKIYRKSQLLSNLTAPLRSHNGSSRNAITAQAETHAGYGITSHSTRYNGRHQGGRETIPSGRRCQANVLSHPKYLCKSQCLSHFALTLGFIFRPKASAR